ncbi:MAG: methyltransferase domain-containing protein [Verrucomicrobiota bacterium]
MTPLTQYGRMAEKHWREHRPKMVRELERKGLLHQMLLEAEEKTKDEMATLRTDLMQQGSTAQQAHDAGVGDGAGEIHPAPARRDLAVGHQRVIRKNRRGISTATASPKPTGSVKADRSRSFSRIIEAIQTLRKLDAEERPATAEEKAALVKYVGWGAMPQVFDVDNTDWRKEQVQLSEILSDEEHRSARATTLNAHYTAPTVIGAMYRAAERFGFKGGRVLEPACGIGHFVGLMPEDMLRRSTVTGIEIDPLTARIAKALYPDADIRAQPFEQTKLADGFYDLAISNVPFGDYTVHDPRWNNYKFPIHDYFFAAALEKVRPGGLIMFITSRGTMDKLDSTLRELLSTRTELLGAIRLPNDAFKKNAGTEVTTDIVMLRKLRPGEAPTGPAWKETASLHQRHRRSIHASTNTSPPARK